MARRPCRARRWSHDGEPDPDHPTPRRAAAGLASSTTPSPGCGPAATSATPTPAGSAGSAPVSPGASASTRCSCGPPPSCWPSSGASASRSTSCCGWSCPTAAATSSPSAPIRRGDAGPIALLVVAAFLLVGGVFSIGQGDGWFAPLWLIPVAIVAWFVVGRDRRRGIQQYPAPYGTPPPPPHGAPAMSAPTSAPPPAGGAPVAPAGEPPSAPTAPYAVPPHGERATPRSQP